MKLVEQTIQLPENYSLTKEATEYVDGLLMESKGVQAVDSPQSQQQAVRMGREIRKHLAEVEMTRKQLKEPILNAGRLLDDIARDHCQPMLNEVARLEGLVGGFQLAEQRRIEQAEQTRQAEIDRLSKERLKAEQALEDSKPSGDDALDDINQANAEMALEAAEERERAVVIAPLPEPVKARGAATGQKMVIEVIDVKALFAARPDLCRIEANLAAIRATCFPETPVPGLKLTWVSKTTIRK